MSSAVRLLLLCSGACIVAGVVRAAREPAEPPETASAIDLDRYTGKWFEIARLPNWFERKCSTDVTATYILRPDGKLTVVNECRQSNGQTTRATGSARVATKNGPRTKLKVTFFWPFSGDYWILDLDPDYRWALVGEPGRRYLWILSRAPRLDDAEYRDILERARRRGYELAGLVRTKHTGEVR